MISVSTVTAEQIIAADPASVALLLNGPAAGELWPGAVRVHGSLVNLVVRTEVPGRGDVEAHVTVTPLRTMPTSYGADFTIASDQLPPIRGRLRLDYETAGLTSPGTRATLRFDYSGAFPDRLRVLALAYLANVAAAAEPSRRAG